MSDEEFEELLARSLEGSLPPADERQLWAAVEADAARLARVLEERELHADLRRALTPGGSGAVEVKISSSSIAPLHNGILQGKIKQVDIE